MILDNGEKSYRNESFYIGLTYNDFVKGFRWDSSNAALNFTNWDKGYPLNVSEGKCVKTLKGKWRNIPCTKFGHALCEKGIIDR